MPAFEEQPVDSYKYQWARYVAKRKQDEDLRILREKIGAPLSNSVADIANWTLKESNLQVKRPQPVKPGKFKVGIVGAGCAGLFTGMIIDWLNEVTGLEVDYDILEAGDRVGGRLYTHHFSEKETDYYDVGAMRFPKNDIMRRTFRLFERIGLSEENGGLVPYYLKDIDKVCPTYFNDVQKIGPVTGKDPYEINSGLPPNDRIPEDLIEQDPSDVIGNAIEGLLKGVKEGLSAIKGEGNTEDKIWKLLLEADMMSTREYLSKEECPVRKYETTGGGEKLKIPKGPGFNFNTIEWLETFTYGTGWYNQALAETVLEHLDFTTEQEDTKAWVCVMGGAQRIATKMAEQLKKKPQFSKRVTAIDAQVKKTGNEIDVGPIKLTVKDGKNAGEREEKEYFAIFNSTTLGAFQRMDLTKAGLLYGTKQAIRSLGYGASCKVGIKFKSAWWQKDPFFINKGGVAKTDLPLRVCVYPSYNLNNPDKESAVLLCSYTWAQDAQRIGTLISEKSPNEEEELKELLFHNLALLHANDKTKSYADIMQTLHEEYMDHFSYDWYNDNNMSGAFAYFGPGQFSNMWPEITKPNAYGQLYFIGEAASAHHAWVVGGLESAVRGVYFLLQQCNDDYILSGGKEPNVYTDAMDKLSTDNEREHLPFYPLPREIPKDQLKPRPEKKKPGQAEGEGPLDYAAAQVLMGLLESIYYEVEKAGVGVEPVAT